MGSVMSARLGIDLVAVDSVRAAIRIHEERYLRRVYTDAELRDCRGRNGIDPDRLAARFAAKEAAIKVLRPGSEGLALTAIELKRLADGSVEIELSGRAAELAAAAHLTDFAVTVTHEGDYAAAVVMAQGLSNPRNSPIMRS